MASSTEAETRGTAASELREQLAVLADLRAAEALLGWDRETMMPARGADARGEVTATLEQLAHERLAGAELADLLDAAAAETADDPDGQDAAIVRVVRRDHDRAARIPVELTAEMARATAAALPVWAAARADVGLRRLPPAPRAPGRAAARGRGLLPGRRASLRRAARGLRAGRDDGRGARGVRDAARRARPADRADRRAPGPAAAAGPAAASPASARSALEMARAIGYDDDGLAARRLDAPVLDERSAPGDQRVTARWDDADLGGIFAVLHEVGHGLYEQQVEPGARPHDARHRRLARRPRVAEPAVGEPGRPLARVLEPLAPARAAGAAVARRPGPRRVPAQRQRRAADADPRRGRRGDLRAPRDPALPARGRADRGDARGRRRPGGLERRHARPARRRASRTTPAAACRTSTGRSASSATSRRTRSATS